MTSADVAVENARKTAREHNALMRAIERAKRLALKQRTQASR